MLGVGVGFDTKGAGKIDIVTPGSVGNLEDDDSQVKTLYRYEPYLYTSTVLRSCCTVNNSSDETQGINPTAGTGYSGSWHTQLPGRK